MSLSQGPSRAIVDGRQVLSEHLASDACVAYPADARAAAGPASGTPCPYVYFCGPGIEFVTTHNFGSQFVREVVSLASGLPHGSWDRRVHTSRDNMFATYRRLAAPLRNSAEDTFGFMPRSGM